MALDYDGSPNGIFRQIGVCVKYIDLFATDASDLDTDRDAIEDNYEAADQADKSSSVRSAFDGLKSSIFGVREQLRQTAELRLQDRVSVINELDLATDSIDTVLRELVRRMVIDSETVDASTVTLGSVTAASGNTGTGTILIGKVLDGVTEPGSGLQTYPELNGVDSQLAVTSETMTINCVGDSYTDGATEGSEEFEWYGEITGDGGFNDPEGGSGTGPTLTTVNADNILDNGDFEDWSGSSPSDWTVAVGTAGTHVQQEIVEIYRGDSSLELTGTGAQATIAVTQAVDTAGLVPGKRYIVTFWYKASAVDTASQSFTVKFTGTGYTEASSEKVTVLGDVFDTSWTLKHFYINLPLDIPEDWTLDIRAAGTLGSGKKIYFDDVCFAPVNWHGGIHAVVVAGQTAFVRNDRSTFTVANDNAGLFQRFFRRGFGIQLPSVTDTSETIADSLAS